MSYDELSLYGRLRKQSYCGPYSMFCKLLHVWSDKFSPEKVNQWILPHYTFDTMNITSSYILYNEYYLIIHSIQWILPHYTFYTRNITSLYTLYNEYYLIIHLIQWILPHYTFYTMNITSLYILYNQYYLIIHSIQ
jgi:hypothetical protein